MKILFVDDNESRIQGATERLVGCCGVRSSDIVHARSAIEARSALSKTHFDLLVLDILIPNRTVDTPSVEASMYLLDEIVEGEGLIKPVQVIGLTAFSNALERVSERFAERLWTILYADITSTAWLESLEKCVTYLKEQAAGREQRRFGTDLLLVTALQKPEMTAVRKLKWDWEAEEPFDSTTFISRGRFKSGEQEYKVISACPSRVGMVSTAVLSAKLIALLRPRVCAMVGICAGVRDKTKLGDILVADPTWDYQSGKRVRDAASATQFSIAPHQLCLSEELRARADVLRGDHQTLAAIRTEWPSPPSHELRLLIGPVASGSAVLADGATAIEVQRQQRNLIGIEMELYGLFAAGATAGRPAPMVIGMKSVCDFADPDKADDMQEYAAFTSARAVQVYFERFMHELVQAVA